MKINQQSSPVEEIYQETEIAQNLAANPSHSVFVSANAGTGKTHILVNRVLRLLLDGCEPQRILCLTYTKAAAAEMENRLFTELSKWVTMNSELLNNTLIKLLGAAPSDAQNEIARQLFARAIETPGGMKVLTIHGFCEKLLQRFPLEANIPPNFSVLDETASKEILSTAMAKLLGRAVKNPSSEEAKSLKEVIAYSTDAQFETLIQAALRKRAVWGPLVGTGRNDVLRSLAAILELPDQLDRDAAQQKMANSASDDLLAACVNLLGEHAGKRNDARADALNRAKTAANLDDRNSALMAAFLTSDKKPFSESYLATKAVHQQDPALFSRLIKAQQQFYNAYVSYEKQNIAIATTELLFLANKIVKLYEREKARRAGLDYQDLIELTGRLLTTRKDAAWVLYKLDQGLDHILVDEAQDTSPEQWQVISALSGEFFAGSGISEREQSRTLFAVGDEKQSIYGFQGAEPKQFAKMANKFKRAAGSAKKSFKTIPLNLSFRSTSAILTAVDHVFSSEDLTNALSSTDREIIHFSNRYEDPGLVEIWDTERKEKSGETDAFSPLSESETDSSKIRLARKIARTIKGWLDQGEILGSKNRPICPGDILILMQRRTALAAPIIQALKAENIPVAGADRITITEQLAVMDILALGEFLLLPEDDLALANVLKSPIFDFDDDDLFTLSYGRKGSLWQSLRYFASREPKYELVAAKLSRWLSRADILPPFEFFAQLIEGEGLRQKFLARLGTVAGDALDEFLNLSLTYDELEPPSLQGFLAWISRAGAEIKRDMEKDRDEVRVMTVHGAKGLEAEIVILPDTCSTRSASQSENLLTVQASNKPDDIKNQTMLWSLANKGHIDALKGARAAKNANQQEEQMRLLYVAMTRARDRLYITGFEGGVKRSANCWYNIITEALAPYLKEHQDSDGNKLLRLETGSKPKLEITPRADEKKPAMPPLPNYLSEKAPIEPVRTIPVSPSSIIPYETPGDDEDKLPAPPALLSPAKLNSDGRFIRGRLVHKLLEHLPNLEPNQRAKAAEVLSRHHGANLHEQQRKSIIRETLEIIENPEYAPLFAPGSKAEVALVARIIPKKTGKIPIVLSGQVDRLVISDNEILIVDYKSNRPSPRMPTEVAESYLAQLAAYRIALRDIYPNHPIRAALLWTDAPFFMEIPSDLLDKYELILTPLN